MVLRSALAAWCNARRLLRNHVEPFSATTLWGSLAAEWTAAQAVRLPALELQEQAPADGAYRTRR